MYIVLPLFLALYIGQSFYYLTPFLKKFIQVCEENRPAASETAKEFVEKSLKDNGCIAYDIFESSTRSDVLMICETWKDAESLSAHEKAEHFVTVVPKLQGLGAMKLEKFTF